MQSDKILMVIGRIFSPSQTSLLKGIRFETAPAHPPDTLTVELILCRRSDFLAPALASSLKEFSSIGHAKTICP
jgi:hypothetical protein